MVIANVIVLVNIEHIKEKKRGFQINFVINECLQIFINFTKMPLIRLNIPVKYYIT